MPKKSHTKQSPIRTIGGNAPLESICFIAIDIETTGSRPGSDELIEVGAAVLDDGVVTVVCDSLVHAKGPIPPVIRNLTGIDPRDLVAAPLSAAVMKDLISKSEGCVVVAHNSRFDLSFLDHLSIELIGRAFTRPAVDTEILARALMPDVHRTNLKILSEHFELPVVPDHRAANDAAATAHLLAALIPIAIEQGVSDLDGLLGLSKARGQAQLAALLPITASVPAARGVGVVLDESGRGTHVLAGDDLRHAVRSLLYVDEGSPRRAVAENLRAVRASRTGTPLGVIIGEERLMRRHRPEHQIKRRREPGLAYIQAGQGPYPPLLVVAKLRSRGRWVGPFTSRGAALRIADELKDHFRLRRCTRRLAAGIIPDCKSRENGLCPAPCTQSITSSEYSARLAEAFDVFGGGRKRFDAMLEDVRHGDMTEAQRAFRRLSGTLDSVTRGCAERAALVAGIDGEDVAVHIVRRGLPRGLVLVCAEALRSGSAEVRLTRALSLALRADPGEDCSARLDAYRLRELLVTDRFRRAGGGKVFVVREDPASAVRAAISYARRQLRVPSVRHA